MPPRSYALVTAFVLSLTTLPGQESSSPVSPAAAAEAKIEPSAPPSPENAAKIKTVIEAARKQIGVTKTYDPDYSKIDFPGGDVPMDRGVCTDVIVRAMRAANVDLQVLVNEDMKRAWIRYPKLWDLKAPDTNIDHRRVPNLMMFFNRMGKRKRHTKHAVHYPPGDFVVWKLPNGLLHIGLVSDRKSEDGTPLIIHNIGAGTQEENILFQYELIGHYRWFGEEPQVNPQPKAEK